MYIISSVHILLNFPPYIFRYKSMLPVLEMASVHNVELVKFFFKLLYQADTRRAADSKGKYQISRSISIREGVLYVIPYERMIGAFCFVCAIGQFLIGVSSNRYKSARQRKF